MLDFKDYYREIEEILCLYEFIFLMFFIGFVNNLFKKKDLVMFLDLFFVSY